MMRHQPASRLYVKTHLRQTRPCAHNRRSSVRLRALRIQTPSGLMGYAEKFVQRSDPCKGGRHGRLPVLGCVGQRTAHPAVMEQSEKGISSGIPQ